jgi:hypothetical protein
MSEFSDWLQSNWIDLARLGVQAAILAAVVRYGRRLLATLRASQEQIGALLKLSVAEGVSPQASATRNFFERESERERETEPTIGREPFAEPSRATDLGFGREVTRPRVAITEPEFEPALAAALGREAARQPSWQPERAMEPAFEGPASMRAEYLGREHSLGGRAAGSPVSTTALLDPPIAHNEPASLPNYPESRGEQSFAPTQVRSFTPWVSAPARAPEPSASVTPGLAPARSGGVQSWLTAPIRSSGPGPVKKMIRWLQTPAGSRPRRPR